ncbi:hypothetical protein EV174_004173 [Coemansia sp. RSA 2320]|nr:hypothetical protein EV174_004173 [Coemansia sp. RSA 2320]
MRAFTVILVSSIAVNAQEIGFSGGASVASGTSAINNPNINNGWQADSSLFSSGEGGGGNLFNGVSNSHFVSINSNAAIQDNLLNNPALVNVAGNSGWTANGDKNALGPVQNSFGGAPGTFFRRGGNVIFAGGYHGAGPAVSLPPIVYHPVQAPYAAPVAVLAASPHYVVPIVPVPKPVPEPAVYSAPPPAPKPTQHSAPPPPPPPPAVSYAAAPVAINK